MSKRNLNRFNQKSKLRFICKRIKRKKILKLKHITDRMFRLPNPFNPFQATIPI